MNPDACPEQVVYLCDDEASVREGLSFMLGQRGFRTQAFASGPELLAAIDAAPAKPRGIFIIDLKMEPMSGLALHEALRARGLGERNPVIVLTGHGDIETAVQEMKKGAAEFIEKPGTPELIAGLVHRQLRRERELHAAALAKDGRRAQWDGLSRQQRRVLLRVAEGKFNKVIAWELGLSERAIEDHRAKGFDKLALKSAAELATRFAEMRADGLRVVDEEEAPRA